MALQAAVVFGGWGGEREREREREKGLKNEKWKNAGTCLCARRRGPSGGDF